MTYLRSASHARPPSLSSGTSGITGSRDWSGVLIVSFGTWESMESMPAAPDGKLGFLSSLVSFSLKRMLRKDQCTPSVPTKVTIHWPTSMVRLSQETAPSGYIQVTENCTIYSHEQQPPSVTR